MSTISDETRTRNLVDNEFSATFLPIKIRPLSHHRFSLKKFEFVSLEQVSCSCTALELFPNCLLSCSSTYLICVRECSCNSKIFLIKSNNKKSNLISGILFWSRSSLGGFSTLVVSVTEKLFNWRIKLNLV